MVSVGLFHSRKKTKHWEKRRCGGGWFKYRQRESAPENISYVRDQIISSTIKTGNRSEMRLAKAARVYI